MDITLLLKAAVMGIVEGLTEFLPISSTGHLILVGALLGFDDDKAKVFDIAIQTGAILAVIIVYWQKIRETLSGLASQPFGFTQAHKFALNVLIAFLPAVVLGLLFGKYIKAHLFTPLVVATTFVVGGLIILWVEQRNERYSSETTPLSPAGDIPPTAQGRTNTNDPLAEHGGVSAFDPPCEVGGAREARGGSGTPTMTVETMTPWLALKVGLVQCFAMIPGTSRSGATIIGGMLLGLSRKAATDFSFYLAIPTLIGAGAYSLYKERALLTMADVPMFAVGLLFSFLSAWICVRWLLKYIATHSFVVFAWYRIVFGLLLGCSLLTGCSTKAPALPTVMNAGVPTPPLACDDGIKAAFKPDALTTVVAVKSYRHGEKVFVSDSSAPVTLAADLCMVKLLVGPGNPGPEDARSTSAGIGIEVWLPTHTDWNSRIRNYGGGGYVGGNHIHADSFGASLDKAVGSKFPAPVIAGMGYVSGTTDAGQRWSQNGAFNFLPNGKLNTTLIEDFSTRSLYEQAIKTQALVKTYYGMAHKFAYFDGHSTGGRQGWKMAQEYPELYDGFLIAAPAQSTSKFALSSFYAQIVMKEELGFTSADPAFTTSNFKQRMTDANKRAVAACDKEKLGFLLDPFACNYDPSKDALALCTGVAIGAVTGTNSDEKSCVNTAQARAINRIWYGPTTDGSFDENETPEQRSGKVLGKTTTGQQQWWNFPRGADWGSLISRVGGAESIALSRQDIRYAPSKEVSPSSYWHNSGVTERDKWREVDMPLLVDTFAKGVANQADMDHLNTDSADLRKLQSLRRKVVVYTGLAEDAIPPATSINHYERVVTSTGSERDVQKFLRLYLVPAKAHSSQGRAYTVSGNNNAVPLPRLPGAGNQTPTREQDQMFSALQDWVEMGFAPTAITLTSRDSSTSYPICVYPHKAVWSGAGSSKMASNYSCK